MALAFVTGVATLIPGSSRPAFAQEAKADADAEGPKSDATAPSSPPPVDGPSSPPPADAAAPDAAPGTSVEPAATQEEKPSPPEAEPATGSTKAATPAPAEAEPEPPQYLEDEVRGLDSSGTPEAPTREGEERDTGSKQELPEGEKRDVPNYDGRPAPPIDAGDIVRWGPKALLFPAWVVVEYGLRIPIVWTVTRIEESHAVDRVADFFSWDDGRGYVIPFASIDFGLRTTFGFLFNWEEVVPRNDVSASFMAGLNDYWSGSFKLDQKFFRDENAWIRWKATYNRKPDNVYFSVSDPEARCDSEDSGCRYRTAVAEASLGLVGWEEFLNQVTFETTFRHVRFSNENTDTPPLTDEEAADLAGFTSGYQIIEPRLTFALDTRHEDLNFSRGTGVRFEGQTAFAIDVNYPDYRWYRAGGELIGFWDLGFGQVLGSSIYYEGLVNVGNPSEAGDRPEVPFYELPYMGGSDQMRGFLPRRLIGHNAIAYKFEYTYPISWGVDATIFASIGNTFERLSEWHIEKNYLTYGLALRLAENRVFSIEALLGWGSNRLDSAEFEPFDQFRCSVGVHKGF